MNVEAEPGAELDLSTLATRVLGRRVLSLHRVDSTSDELWERAEKDGPHGMLCVAREQSAGRGRQGRSWRSEPDEGLYASLLLRPEREPGGLASFSLLSALVIAETLEAEADGLPVQLKWPNDVWVEGRKLGGILLESRGHPRPALVLGVGLNLRRPSGGWPEGLRGRATSLEEAIGRRVERGPLLAAFLNRLEPAWEQYLREGLSPFVAAWSARSVLEGRWVRARGPSGLVRVRVEGLDEGGRLRVRHEDGRGDTLGAGEVHLLGEGER